MPVTNQLASTPPIYLRIMDGVRRSLTVRAALLAVAMTTAVVPAAPAVAQEHFPDDEDLQTMLRYLVEDGETPGIVLGLIEADGSTRILSYGETGTEATLGERSVFEMGSITKAFTGILLADMVAQGEVSLSDPLSMYMPDGVTIPTWEGREITLLDVATHRSSLPRMAPGMSGDGQYSDFTMEDLHAFVSGHELRREIGSEFEYSNIAVALLGDALARAAGQTYEELLRERILDPLDMSMTSTHVDGEIGQWMTRGHNEAGDPAPYRNWPDLPAMGALRSSAADMLTFLAANLAVQDSRLGMALQSAREPRAEAAPERQIGLNWQIATMGGRTIVTHGGGTAGYSTRIAFDTDLGVGIVRLSNTSDFDDDVGMDALIRGRPLDIPEVEVSRSILESYVGLYEPVPGQQAAAVRLEPEGYLTVQTPGNVRFRMYAESDTSFFLKRTPWRFTFTNNEAGAVDGLLMIVGGNARQASKVEGEMPSSTLLAGNPLDLTLSDDQMASYVGAYEVAVGDDVLQMRILVEGGELVGQMRQTATTRLIYQGDHTFAPAMEASTRIIFTVEDGLATGVEVHQAGQIHRGVRTDGG